MALSIPRYKLLSGNTIPSIGLGTDKIVGRKMVLEVLDRALSAGYRALDTAAMYGNEHDIGFALKELLPKHNLKREDVFIATKLLPDDHGERAADAFRRSLNNLDCGYLDLYLIHWPGTFGSSGDNSKMRDLSWSMLVEMKKRGLVKDLGVSNYTVRHLNELLSKDHGVKPVLNQIEWHPGCHQEDIKELCNKEGIVLQAYMPLGGTGNARFLNDATVVGVAKKLEKSPAQVLLRWCLQQNVAVIPKAQSKQHLEENLDLDFAIPNEDMVALGNRKPVRFDWDPTTVN